MKALYTFLILSLLGLTLVAQVPQGFTYQSVARNAIGSPISNTALQVKIAITSDAAGNSVVWEEQHNINTNDAGFFTLIVGDQAATRIRGSAPSFSAIDWAAAPLYIMNTLQYQGTWHNMGTAQLWSVPYSMLAARSDDFAGTFDFNGDTIVILKSVSIGAGDAGKALLAVTSLDDTSDDPLFEVKRKDGQTVFAVYNDAVNIYVPPSSGKATKGGFAIGSFNETKGGFSQDFFRVTPDSVRIYINDDPTFTKGSASKGGFAIGSFETVKGVSKTYLNVTAASTVDTVLSKAQLLWYPKKEAFLAGRILIESSENVGLNSTALGYHSMAKGNWSQAFGYVAKATADYATAIGNNALASGSDSYALGSGAEATGVRSFALGSVGVDEAGNATGRKTIASGPYTVAIGMGAQATTQSAAMAFGTNATASGFASTSIGYNSTASNHYSVAIGFRSTASQYYAHAFGLQAEATAQGSLALGMYSKASGNYSSAMGYWSQASKQYSVAIGYYALAQGDYSGSFGRSANASGLAALSMGFSTIASGQYSVGIGYQSNASNTYATAIGFQAKASAANSFSFGNNAEAAGENSFAIGTHGLNSDGTVNTTRPTKTFLSYSVALGMGAQSTKKGALSFGVNPTASGDYSTAIGYGPTASANYSTAIGVNALSNGNYSTAIGVNASAEGTYSTAMGYGTNSPGNYSISMGMNSSSTGTYATALGYSARAYGDKSLALGSHYSYTYYRLIFNKLTGGYIYSPVTVNRYNTATRAYSIAIGNGNTAEDGGMALGTNNYALSAGSVAIGHSNTADTSYSFAAGYGNNARAFNSFALGENLTAQSSNSFVIGTYNNLIGNKYQWVETDPLFVIGNGESGATHDAFRVNKNGGTYIYPQNASIGLSINAGNTSESPYTFHYALLSLVNRNKAGGTYYSGYFYDVGSQGTYNGLYADIRTGGAIDVAEYIYDSFGNTEPADVVVADPNKTESVIKSSAPYQSSVLGVISTKPHLTLGMELVINEETGEPLEGVQATRLTLTGRVPVKVTTENGQITPGDLLTTSSTPGYAMKWSLLDVNAARDFEEMKSILAENEKRRNAIIGKAVEAHNSGTGTIVVLVSLQ